MSGDVKKERCGEERFHLPRAATYAEVNTRSVGPLAHVALETCDELPELCKRTGRAFHALPF